ncbi:MAG TPA: hypothetical protein VFU46_02970 [Gemmatimonadales bacterium]|nr:hypothetical protein [Gemmatimonadales bacterium]
MDLEAILALILIFGGGTAVALSFSPIGRAIAQRIREAGAPVEPDTGLRGEVEALRQELAELHERVDFAERLLARQAESARLAASPEEHG